MDYPAGGVPAAIAIADLNGDGTSDLAVANDLDAGTVTVLLGNADGTFQAGLAFPAGFHPRVVTPGDFNRDNKLDLVVANDRTINGTASILLGNGNGTFQAPRAFATGTSSDGVAVADFNLDSKPDIAVSKYFDGNLAVLLGDGDGTFQSANTYNTGTGTLWVTTGDFNGDGRPDLATADSISNTVSVLLGNGDGTFAATMTTGGVFGAFSVAVGDFNGDSRADLVAAAGISAVVLQGNGDGTFQAPVYNGAGASAESVAVADFNSDGKLDIVVAGDNGNLAVLLGNGDGTFQNPFSLSTAGHNAFVAVGNVNSDGTPDFAATNVNSAKISVFLNPRATTNRSTLQDFDSADTGSLYIGTQYTNPPGPTLMNGGPTGTGAFLRLVSANPDPAPPSVNTVAFDLTDPGSHDQIVIDFDFRMTPGNGRADGFGIGVLDTSELGTWGAVRGTAEEANFRKSFGVGFDIYQNDDLADIGNDFVRSNYSNSVSIHFGGAVLANGQFDATPIVDLASGEWIHARIVMRPGGGFSDASVILTPPGGSPVTLIDRFPVPGFVPYEGRLHFGARAGGETANHDLDNIRADFSNFPSFAAGLLEFGSATVTVNESGPVAQVTVTRRRGSTGLVSVQYATSDGAAIAGGDYTTTSGTLTFLNGDANPKTVTIPIRDNSAAEPVERFRVFLANPTGGAVLGVASEAMVTILDDDGTVQDFDVPGIGTAYKEALHVFPPTPTQGPELLAGGPSGIGNFLRLASEIATEDQRNHNSITFNRSDDIAADVVVADFDFRITPRTGRADGFGFAFLNTANYGLTGSVAPQEPLFAAEEPNFAGSLGVGFDIYNNYDPNSDGVPEDPSHPDRNGNEIAVHNIVSIHFNGNLLRQVEATPAVDLANGQWIHAKVTIMKTPDRAFGVVTVALSPCNGGSPVTVIPPFEVTGLQPYVGRAWFGARSGGISANHDLDNVNLKFLNLSQSVLSLSANSYSAGEGGPAVLVTINRSGNTIGTTTVHYMTENVTAQAGTDYTATTGTVVFDPGETRKSFSVPILDDTNQEADPVFRVSLQDSSSGAVLGGPSMASVTIFDDETSASVGHWSSVICTSVAAVHSSLLPNGNIMYWDRVGEIRILDPVTMTITNPDNPGQNVFCSGHSFLANGDLLVAGGHEHGGSPEHDGQGLTTAVTYNSFTRRWDTSLPAMNAGRWYPTNTTLGTGEVLVLSGSSDIVNNDYIHNPLPQIWVPSSRTWRSLTAAEMEQVTTPGGKQNQPLGVDLYPRLFLAPDGRVFKVGPDKKTWFLDTTGLGHWTAGPPSNFGLRTYGAAVMYAPGKVLIVGGGQATNPDPGLHATATAEVIDLNLPDPTWRTTASMSMEFARRQLNATLLPDGRVLVTGGTGGPGFNNEGKPVLPAEVWDPDTEKWTTLPAMQVTRGYHSTALLIPDGRVFSAGGGQGANALSFYNNAEFYSPSYLFNGSRPTIASTPIAVTYGESFFVETPDAASITKASLIRLPSVTHSFDQNSRFISLGGPVRMQDGVVATVPASPNVAPPGHYMLFILNSNGVPSIAKIIQIIDPLAVDDNITTAEDTPVSIAVLANDISRNSDPLTVDMTIGPANGMLTRNADATLTYIPSPNFSGSDSFTYTVNNGTSTSNTATVTITVTPANDAPLLDNTGTPYVIAPAGSRLPNDMQNGILIMDLLARGAQGNPITDPDAGALEGIAVTAIDESLGKWQYTQVVDPQEADWIDTDAAGAISYSSALLLPADANARLRFVTTLVPFHGSSVAAGHLPTETKLDAGLTFRAWDRTMGTAGGRADTTVNGGTTVFSTATETVGTYFETRLWRTFNAIAQLNTYTLELEATELMRLYPTVYLDRSTSAYSGFTVFLSPIPGVPMTPLYRLYFGIAFDSPSPGIQTDMGLRYLTTSLAEAQIIETYGPPEHRAERDGCYFREAGVNAGTGIIGYIYSTQQSGTTEMFQIYRTDLFSKDTRTGPPGTPATGTVQQEHGDHVYTTQSAFEMTKTPGQPHIEGVQRGWRQESARGFVRELSPNAGGSQQPARSALAQSATASFTKEFFTASSPITSSACSTIVLPALIAPTDGRTSKTDRLMNITDPCLASSASSRGLLSEELTSNFAKNKPALRFVTTTRPTQLTSYLTDALFSQWDDFAGFLH